MSMCYNEADHAIWVRNNGAKVLIDGILHTLRVMVYRACYPYAHEAIMVDAEPTNKSSAYYLEGKRKLGDDWSVDLLASDVVVMAGVMEQLH